MQMYFDTVFGGAKMLGHRYKDVYSLEEYK